MSIDRYITIGGICFIAYTSLLFIFYFIFFDRHNVIGDLQPRNNCACFIYCYVVCK